MRGSIRIQRALFFTPQPPPPSNLEPGDHEDNPLLHGRFPAWIVDGENELGDKIATFIPLSLYREGPDPLHVADPDASWRRMLLTQPPHRVLEFFAAEGQAVCYDDGREFSERMVFRVEDEGGITMDVVMRAVEDAHLSDLPDHYEPSRYPHDTEWVLCLRDRCSEFYTETDTWRMFPDLVFL